MFDNRYFLRIKYCGVPIDFWGNSFKQNMPDKQFII